MNVYVKYVPLLLHLSSLRFLLKIRDIFEKFRASIRRTSPGAVRLAKGELKGESRDGKGDGCEGDGVFPGNNTSDFFGVALDFL